MTPLSKGERVYTRHGEPARVLQAYCDGTVCIALKDSGQVLHIDRRWVSTLEESFGVERREAVETVVAVGAAVLTGCACARALML